MQTLARSGRGASWFNLLSPLVFIFLMLLTAMFATSDMGPLLVCAYGFGLFAAAAVMYFVQYSGMAYLPALCLGLICLFVCCGLVTLGLFVGGEHVSSTVLARLESVTLPLSSSNDQIGIVSWFRSNTPVGGYGTGHVPWCGYAASGVCQGVPRQIHSDYTYTALWGIFGSGWSAFWVALSLVWLYRIIRAHGRMTSGVPIVVVKRLDTQAFLSWLCVSWLILTCCQVGITVAGNLRILPLTGITYPFISFGATSLWINTIFLGLAQAVDVPEQAAEAVAGENTSSTGIQA